MTTRKAVWGAVAVALAGVAVFTWRSRTTGDERAIRARLEQLRTEINSSTTGGLGLAGHVAQIGNYFTDDVVIELGEGASPIRGREMLIGMAARLQPRTSAFRLELDDVGVEIAPEAHTADVILTASFVRRDLPSGEQSRDAREFAVTWEKDSATWRIARITAIDTLR